MKEEEEEKGTWLLPFREQYSPKKKWRVYVSSGSAWWVAPLKPLYIIWPGQQKRLESAQVNHSDVVDGLRLYLLICSDTLKNKINKKKTTVFTVNSKSAWACFSVLYRFSEIWAISNSAASCKVHVKTRLNGSLQVIIFLKIWPWKSL